MKTRGLLACMIAGAWALSASGCQVVERRTWSVLFFSQASAGYAGRFRIATGRWPATPLELEEFSCMADRAERYGLRRLTCDEVVNVPYRTEMHPVGEDLRLRYIDAAGARMCSLRLRAPPADADRTLAPMIVIETTVFSCTRAPEFGQDVRID